MRSHNLQKPARLYWNMTPELAEVIDNAVKFAQKVNDPTVPLNCIQTSVFYAWATKKIAELLT